MELKLVILSLACFSCLVPPALGTSILAAKAAAVGAGALLAKGALLKGAALLGAKAAVVKGAALLAKGAAIKGAAALAAKGAAIAAAKPSIQVQIPETTVVVSPPKLSTIMERLSNVISVAHAAAHNKTVAVGGLLASLLPTKTVVHKLPPHPQLVLQPVFIPTPNLVMPPSLRTKTVQPSVAIVGPSMNVYN